MVNIALPAIMDEFNSNLADTEWVVLAYLLTTSSTLLIWGHIGDRIGRNLIYRRGLLIFGGGSLGCALAPSLSILVGCRFGQALGAAMMMAAGPAIIKKIMPATRLGRGMGLIGIPVSLGLMAGPVISGILIDTSSWRGLFFLSGPLALLLYTAALMALPRSGQQSRENNFDWPGGGLWAIILITACLLLTSAGNPPVSVPHIIGTTVLLAVFSIIFYRWEKNLAEPILPVKLLARRFFAIGICSASLSFHLLFTVLIIIPFYLKFVLHTSALQTGMIMTAIPLSALVIAPAAGWLADHIGARILSTTGLAISTTGLILLSGLTTDSQPLSIALRLSLLGIGQAMFLSPNSASVLLQVKDHVSGTAAAMLATARNLGMMSGIAISSLCLSLAFHRFSNGLNIHDFQPELAREFCKSLQITLLATSLLGAGATFLSWQRPSPTEKREINTDKVDSDN